MKKGIFVFFIVMLIVLPIVFAYTPPADSPLGRGEHPRIWITKENIPDFQKKLSTEWKSEYQEWVNFLDVGYGIDLNLIDSTQLSSYLINYAFVYQVNVPDIIYGHSREEYRDKAKAILSKMIVDKRLNYFMAVGYDWLYYDLSPETRVAVRDTLAGLEKFKVANPLRDADIKNNFAQIFAGIALFGDGINDTEANKRVDYYTYINGPDQSLLALHNFIAGDDGAWSQGLSYSTNDADVNGGSEVRVIRLLEAWRTANNFTKEEVFGGMKAAVLRYYPQWAFYHITPFKTLYKTHNMDATGKGGLTGLNFNIAASRYLKDIDSDMASLSQWAMVNNAGPGLGLVGSEGREGVGVTLQANFIFGEKVVPKSPKELGLPLTKKFDNYGWVVMRTGWESEKDSMITFIASPWSRMAGSYSNANQNSFTIDRQGPLALNSGAGIHQGYANKAWAYNLIIFPDPNEASRSNWDMGGQRVVASELLRESQLKPGSTWDLGGIQRFEAAKGEKDYDYISSDATRAYNGPLVSDSYNTKKVKLFRRQFVYFRPETPGGSDKIIIFDRVETTDTKFEKRWLLHTPGNPKIDGVEKKQRDGEWRYEGASLITDTNTEDSSYPSYSGKIFSKSLLPEQRYIVKIGGPDPTGKYFTTTSHEYEDPYGNNGITDGASPNLFTGTYRVEVRPSVPSTYDVFLHTLEATDAAIVTMTSSDLVQGNGFVGARFGNRIAVFNRIEANINVGDFVINQNGNYKVLVADLNPFAEYKIEYGGVSLKKIASDAGTIYFDAAIASLNTLVKISSTGVTNPPPTATFSATLSSIKAGEFSTLSWTSSGATSVRIDPGIGVVSSSGSLQVRPELTTSYTLTASNDIGSTTKSVTIDVTPLVLDCSEGLVTSKCKCDGTEVSSGYCCSGKISTTACSTCVSSPEICDGKDNDCDSSIDEGLSCGNVPTAPSNLIVQLIGGKISLNWNDNSDNEGGFVIERSVDGATWEEVSRVGANIRTWEDSEVALSPGYGLLDRILDFFRELI